MNSALMTVLIQYLKQPSTWQGITLLAGSLATWLGVPVEAVTSAGVLLLAVTLIVKDERPTKDIVQDALGKVLEDKVDKP